jgi:hypothetical protein
MYGFRVLPAALALGAAIAVAPALAQAQSLYLPRDGTHGVLFEMLKPTIEGLNQDFLSGVYFLSGRYGVSPRVSLVAEIPFANQSSTQEPFPYYNYYYYYPYGSSTEISSSTFGNLYLGMEARVASGPVFLEVGVRPPIASEDQVDADLTGIFADVTRWDAFLPNNLTVQAAFDASETAPSGMTYHLRISPVADISTGDSSGNTELDAVYSFLIGYHGDAFRVLGGESGRALLTEGSGNLGRRTVNQLEFHADFLSGSVRPGLAFTLPLGSQSSDVPMVWGINVAWSR